MTRRRSPGGGREWDRFPLDAPGLSPRALRQELRGFLQEDRVDRDVTSLAVVPASLRAVGVVESQADGVVSGVGVAVQLAREQGLRARPVVRDGEEIRRGQPLLLVGGNARRLLSTERTLLNLLTHLSGVATATHRVVRAARSGAPRIVVAATRKTLPGLRDLEKSAVVHGGGDPHRRDLSSAILLKNNHLALVPLGEAVSRARRRAPSRTPVIVEVSDLSSAREAAARGADRLLLDNLSPAEVRAVVRGLERAGLRRNVVVEVSGGITERNAASFARAGADVLSVGALTHSAPSLPIHLVLRAERPPSARSPPP